VGACNCVVVDVICNQKAMLEAAAANNSIGAAASLGS
jgi:hypothetical protein